MTKFALNFQVISEKHTQNIKWILFVTPRIANIFEVFPMISSRIEISFVDFPVPCRAMIVVVVVDVGCWGG